MLQLRLRAVIVTKRLRSLAVAVLATVVLCPGARASLWQFDPEATRVAFSVRNLSVAHVAGRFRLRQPLGISRVPAIPPT